MSSLHTHLWQKTDGMFFLLLTELDSRLGHGAGREEAIIQAAELGWDGGSYQ